MTSPFPGMDPYLEHPARWPSVHAAMIAQMGRSLNKVIAPKYLARIEKRIFVESEERIEKPQMVPDLRIEKDDRQMRMSGSTAMIIAPITVMLAEEVEVEEWSLKVMELPSRKVVTVIELLSLSNKRAGTKSRELFLKKQRKILNSHAHWVEIDLLRGGQRTIPTARRDNYEYAAFVSDARKRPRAALWPLPLEARLMTIGIPLGKGDGDAPLDLQACLDEVYADSYETEIDYTKDVKPPLSPVQARWAKQLLKKRR